MTTFASVQKTYKISNFIQDIVSRNVIQFNKTELACGRTSSYYADFRQLLAYPDLENYIVSQMVRIIDAMCTTESTYDKIAGVAVAGVPWATLVGNKLSKPVSIVRLAEKTHGKKAAIDGAAIKLDDQVILIEDVLTTGGSVINAIRKIHNTGATVTRVICILDRNEGAQEHIKYYFPDIKVSSILSIDTIISVCSANKLITDYIAEQIEFYRESGYTDTIKMLTRLNDNAKEKEYQHDPVKWHLDNYYDIWNLKQEHNASQTTVNPLFVDVSNMSEWNEIKYKIDTIGKQIHNLVIKFDGINNWTGEKQEELLTLHNKYKFNIIYKSAECITQSNVINTSQYTLFNTLKTVQHGYKYPNAVLTNGLILNLYVDTNMSIGLVAQLQDTIKKYELCAAFASLAIHNIFINFVGPGVIELIPNTDFWLEFRNYILSISSNQVLQVKGVIIPYVYLKQNKGIISKQAAIGKLLPLILDTQYTSDFYLEPSMLTDKVNTDYIESALAFTKAYNSNGFTHVMVGADLLQSNTIVETRMSQYIEFLKYLVAQTQKKAFTFMQLEAAYHALNSKPTYSDVINNKVVEFNKKNEVAKPVLIEPQKIEHGAIAKYRDYLLTGINKVLNAFGVSLVLTK